MSAPFKTSAGWHIVQRIGSRQTDAGNQNRREHVRENIGQRKLEDEWNRYLHEMRGEAYVDIRSGDHATDQTTPAPAPATDAGTKPAG